MIPPELTITAAIPKWRDGYSYWSLSEQLRNYTHTIEALGGYWSAQFTIRGDRSLMDDWLQDGLGRHIEVFDHSLDKIWEGFVDKLTVNYGPLSATRGPLLDIANRVSVAYTAAMRDDAGNTVVGACAVTEDADNTDSQELWGIVPKNLSASGDGIELAEAELIRDTFLANHNRPRTSKEWRAGAGGETSVTVDCLGYVHWLNWPYNDFTLGVIDADAKIVDVLGDSPNAAWLAFDTDYIDGNTLDVRAWEADDNLAWSVIKDIVVKGDASYNRWLFGIYNNMEAHYTAAPTEVYYQQRLSQSKPMIEHIDGHEIYPWQVRPGRWLMFPDFLIGLAPELDLRDDPRAMFIESVKYTMPWDLQIKGGAIDTVDAVLAQLGLSGIGA